VVDTAEYDGSRSVHAVCILLRLLDDETLLAHTGHARDKLKSVAWGYCWMGVL